MEEELANGLLERDGARDSMAILGGLQREWKVAPPSISKAAIPEEAMARAMWPCERTCLRRRLLRWVLPQPPGLYTMKKFEGIA